MTFIIDIFQFDCKNEHKQVKWNQIKQDMCKSENTLFTMWFTTFLDKVYLKNES